MRFSVLALACAASLVSAQTDLSGLPSCAQSCVTDLPDNCSSLDISCICSSKTWITNLGCCVSQKCNSGDQSTTIQFAQKLCLAANPPVTVQSTVGCGASSTAPPSGSSTPPSTATGSRSGTVTGTASPVSASSATNSAPTSASTAVAPQLVAQGGLGAAAGAAVAALAFL